MTSYRMVLLGLSVSFLGACGSAGEDAEESMASVSDANAVLEIHPLDIWGQPLPASDLHLTVTRSGQHVAVPVQEKTTNVFVSEPGKYVIHVEAPYHDAIDVPIDYDGTANAEGARLGEVPRLQGVAFGHTTRHIKSRTLPAHALYIGLRHKYFSAEGRPARRGNDVRLLMDGEEAWSTIQKDMQSAVRSIHLSTWWWQSDFELLRSTDTSLSTEARWPNTILGTLEGSGATKRVLVGQFWGQDSILSWLTTDSKLKKYAAAPNDGFEMMGMANETPAQFHFKIPGFSFGDRLTRVFDDIPEKLAYSATIPSTVPEHDVDIRQLTVDMGLASYHQKFGVIDDELAYIGGMNFRVTDWDTSAHRVHEARRMPFDASPESRDAVASGMAKSKTGPRKDYIVRLDGPSAQDAADVFKKRWDYQRQRGVNFAENASAFDIARDIEPRAGGMQVQITTTLPQPFWEHSLAETWFNAVSHAEKLIYIEDQYFRVPMLNEAIVARMREKPELRLVVVTKSVPITDPGCVQTYTADKLFRSQFPERYLTVQLRSFDPDTHEFEDIDVHSKMIMVDDVFLSVGSANKNNRGIIYEAEMNVAIVDPRVAQFRARIANNMLGERADTIDELWTKLAEEAKRNDAAYGSKGAQPAHGFAYSLSFGAPSSCVLYRVGPDDT